jgi:hypothetical protein
LTHPYFHESALISFQCPEKMQKGEAATVYVAEKLLKLFNTAGACHDAALMQEIRVIWDGCHNCPMPSSIYRHCFLGFPPIDHGNGRPGDFLSDFRSVGCRLMHAADIQPQPARMFSTTVGNSNPYMEVRLPSKLSGSKLVKDAMYYPWGTSW